MSHTESFLVAFLKARLDEDERAARAWPVAQRSWKAVGQRALRYDPARVLVEVEAKRRILAEHGPGSDPCDAHDASFDTVPCDTLLLLTLPYANHPDYLDGWRP